MKFQVDRYETLEDFEQGLNAKLSDGWMLNSWMTDPDWGVVAVFVRDPRIKKKAK